MFYILFKNNTIIKLIGLFSDHIESWINSFKIKRISFLSKAANKGAQGTDFNPLERN
jgi:hypothetical protein